jgi:hypothetical protein
MTLCGSQWRIFLLVFVLLFNLSCKISSDGGNADKSLNSAGTSSGAQAANTSNQDTRSGETSSDSQVSPADSAADNSSNSADTGVSEHPADDSNQDTGAPPDGDMPEQQECTRYVSVSGNNSNSGLTEETAWLTLQKAADAAPQGSVICVAGGTYRERVVVKKSNLTFQGQPRLAPIADGGFEVRASDTQIRGFKITTSVISDWPARYPVFIRADRASVMDNYFYDVKGDSAIQGNWNEYPRNVWIAFNRIYNCAAGINVQGDNWLVEYNEVERLHDYGYSDADYSRFHGDNHIFRHNNFHGTTSADIGGSHVDCFQTFDGGDWATHTHNILIENNVCSGFHQGIMSEAVHNQATDTITVRNNVFANFESSFIQNSHGIIVHDIPYYTIVHNTFVNIGVRGVLIKRAEYGLATNEVVKNSIFYNVNGIAYSFWDGSQTSQGGYNIVYKSYNPDPKWPTDLIGLDPQFVDADQRDFHVQQGSPACDRGENGSYIGAYPCQ